jgi:formamidopyrimidine-DNA glycosylase
MPELPEVEVVRRGLHTHVAGRRIARVEVFGDRTVRRHPGGAADFTAALAGRDVLDIRRRGKYLWWVLDDGDAVLAHLGMSGQFRIGAGDAGALERIGSRPTPGAGAVVSPGHPHLRARFHFADGGPVLDFLDQRTFGGLALAPGGAELPDAVAHIARDPLDPLFDRPAVIARIRSKNTVIKRALLDQTVVSGIGNIYADEALWAAKVHYDRPTAGLVPRTVGALLDAATAVMLRALEEGGTSFDDMYVDVNGESGYFERSLNAYGRAGRPCRRCGTTIRREPFMNRSSYFCPRCQRRSRTSLARPSS